MAIERQAVPGLQAVQSAGLPQGAATQAIQYGTPELSKNSTGFVTDLLNASGELGDAMTLLKQQNIEDDKVLQTNRALQGLLPTESATKGGKRAHMLVGLQNDVSGASLRLSEEAKTWQGTDDEWNMHVIQSRQAIQSDLWKKYPELAGDKESMKMVTNAFMEQQPKVFAARTTAKLDKEIADRKSAMNARIILATDGVTGPALVGGLSQLRAEAGAMGLTDEDFEGMVAQHALDRASVGDTSFVDATKEVMDKNGVSLYAKSGKMQQAAIQGRRMWASLNQGNISVNKFDLEQSYNNGEYDDEEFVKKAQEQNDLTGGSSWSAEEINSVRQAKQKKLGQTALIDNAIDGIQKGHIVGLEGKSPEDMSKIATGVRERYAQQAELAIKQNGLDPKGEQAHAIRTRSSAQAAVQLAKADIKDQTFMAQVKQFSNLSPDHLQDMKDEPEEMAQILETWESYPEEYRTSIVDEKTAAFIDNYRMSRAAGRNAGQALSFAQNAGRPRNFSSDENKEISKGAKDAIGEVMKNSGFTPFDNMPDYLKGQMQQRANEVQRTMRIAGYDADQATKETTKVLQREWSQHGSTMMASGTIIKGNADRLADKLKVNTQDLGRVFQSYLQINKQSLEDDSGGLTLDDMYIDVDQKRGVFSVRAGATGMPVGNTMPLSVLNGNDLLRQMAKSDDNTKMEADARMARNYERAVGPGANLTQPNYPVFKDLSLESDVFTKGDDEKFQNYVAAMENSQRAGFDNASRTFTPIRPDDEMPNVITVGYGHRITDAEAKQGFIMVGDQPVPFKPGSSQMTDENARKLLAQDLESNSPSTSGWKIGKGEMPKAAWRAIQDASYTMGKNFLSDSKTARASFEKGDFGSGIIQLLDTVHEGGKRKAGLLNRRAQTYNLYAESRLLPKITMTDVGEDGSMRVKFSRPLTEDDGIAKSITGKIDKDGWYTVLGSKQGSLHKNTRTGRYAIE